MADREDQPPDPTGSTAVGLSPDEADRLSEKFHPSWEASSAKPVAPTATPAEPRKAAKHTLIGGISPFDAEPPAAPTAEPAKAEMTKKESARPPKQQTLIGIAPSSEPPPLPVEKARGSSPVTAGGSPDGPSGIAKLYKPKDDPAAPPVVLTEEVQKAEAATTAELEARRRSSSSRHMQTVMNIKAPDFPAPRSPSSRKSGLWQLLVGVAAGVLVVAAVFKLTSKEPSTLAPATVEQQPAAAEPAAATPPPVAPEGPTVTPVTEAGREAPVVLPAETAKGDSVEPAPRRTSSKAAAAPKKAAPKASKPSAKETAPSQPAGKGGVIVRDTPF
ncbi:MAG TPA: hypothetical protein VM686_15085 [Polyangiaceae bacterium]|nr:hypothetical protein [Polyangiaceae bacterium]